MNTEFVDNSLSDFAQKMDNLRSDLRSLDVSLIASPRYKRRRLGRSKSFIYVWLSAGLESFVKGILSGLVQELSKLSYPLSNYKPGLIALCHHSIFDSIRDVTGIKQWTRRLQVFQLTFEKSSAIFNPDILPLDGRTLRPHHFAHIWNFFDFPGDPLPSPLHKIALTELAENRNQVAHGEISPTELGRQKTTQDLTSLLHKIEDIAEQLAVSIITYVDEKMYLS
jgi:hypothetical protein